MVSGRALIPAEGLGGGGAHGERPRSDPGGRTGGGRGGRALITAEGLGGGAVMVSGRALLPAEGLGGGGRYTYRRGLGADGDGHCVWRVESLPS